MARACVGDDVGAERDRAAEGAEVDLELLVDAALGVGRAAVAGETSSRPSISSVDLVGVDAGQLGLHDRARRVALVEDVDGGREAAAPAGARPRAVEDVAEQLVHLAPHPLEVREQVALGGMAAL